jgi:hypothetical protein
MANRWPDASLYTFMQCINGYKKYQPGRDQANIFLCQQKNIHQYVNIKNIDLAAPLYARFMFSHRIYASKYMYVRICEFPEAPIIIYIYIYIYIYIHT